MLVSPRIRNQILLGRLFYTSIGNHDLRVYFFSGHGIEITIKLEMSLNYGLFVSKSWLYSYWLIHKFVIDSANKIVRDLEAIIPIYALGFFFRKQLIDLVVYLQICGLVHIAWSSTAWDRCLTLTINIITTILVIFIIKVHLQMRQNKLFFSIFALLLFVPSYFFGS